MNFKILAILLIVAGMLFVASNVTTADQNSSDVKILPGSFWYPFKMLREDIVTLFTFDDASRANRYLDLAQERLREIKKLEIRKSYDQVKKTLTRYQNTLKKAREAVIIAKQSGSDVEEIINRGVDFANENAGVLENIYDNVPDDLKKAVEDARKNTEQNGKDWLNVLKNQFKDQIFNQGKENTKNLKELNNDFKKGIVPKIPNLKNMFIQ